MSKRIAIVWGVLATAGLCLCLGVTVMADASKETKVLRHIVMYKFKDGLAPEKIQEVVEAFSALPKKIPTIIGYEHGTNVSPEGKSEGFTHVFVVTFKGEKDRDDYLVDTAHTDYVKVVRDRREKVVVFDYWTD